MKILRMDQMTPKSLAPPICMRFSPFIPGLSEEYLKKNPHYYPDSLDAFVRVDLHVERLLMGYIIDNLYWIVPRDFVRPLLNLVPMICRELER